MNRGDETKHKPVNQIQQLAIDGESSEMILKEYNGKRVDGDIYQIC